MNIYREVLNRIEIPALPSLENGYYLLRFERNGTTSNVYAVVENESGMGVPITASVTEIGTGTPTPTDGEVLLAPGAWTLFFYEQVSGTNTNPDCSTIPLGQTEVTVYGEDAAVLSQTPTACPSGPGGGITSVNSDTGPAVQLDAVDIPFTPMFVVISGSSPDGQVFRDTGVVLENRHRWTPDGTIPPDPVPTECYYDDTADLWTMVIDNVVVYSANSTAADPSQVSPSAWVVDGGVLPLPVFVGIEATDVQAAVEEVAGEVATKVDAYVDGTQHNVIVAVTGACDADGFITVNFAVASGERPALASAEFIGGCAGPGSNAPILAYLDTATISGYKVQFYDINDGPAGEGTSGRFTVLGVTA